MLCLDSEFDATRVSQTQLAAIFRDPFRYALKQRSPPDYDLGTVNFLGSL
jgi:hypothetical protein